MQCSIFLSLQASPALFLTMNECFFFRKQALRLDKTAVSHDPDSNLLAFTRLGMYLPSLTHTRAQEHQAVAFIVSTQSVTKKQHIYEVNIVSPHMPQYRSTFIPSPKAEECKILVYQS